MNWNHVIDVIVHYLHFGSGLTENIVTVHGKYDNSSDGWSRKSWFRNTGGKIKVTIGGYGGTLLERNHTCIYWFHLDSSGTIGFCQICAGLGQS